MPEGGLQSIHNYPNYDSSPSNIALQEGGVVSEQMKRLLKEKKSAKEFQARRRDDWDDNYDLSRNKVFTNRLTQRQAVNVPLMKETMKTHLAKIDDPPHVEWKELGGDEYKQLLLQGIWDDDYERLGFEAVDMQDKKTEWLYGRTFRKFNWTEDGLDVRALDIYDVLVDPLTDPLDIETARFVIHQNIFRSLKDILADDRYDSKGKAMLQIYLSSKEGIVQGAKNRDEWERKMERIKDMGYDQSDFPLFAGGDVIVNLSEHYTRDWDKSKKKFERRVVVYANERVVLLEEELKNLIGVDFYPFVTWADDPESQDFWSDAPADIVRTPNKILNIWFSQFTENRTLQNFNMHWYAPTQGYQPQTYEPGQGRMLPAPPLQPGQSINDVIMPVQIGAVDESIQSINFLIGMIDKAMASSTSPSAVLGQKGLQPRKADIQAMLAKAAERTTAMAKYYRRANKEFAMKWYQLVNANENGKRTLHKLSRSGKIWPKSVYPSDWKSQFGYKAEVRSSSEQENEKSKGIQKWMFVLQQFSQNQALHKIGQKRMLQLVDLTPEELREVQEAEKQAQQQPQQIQQPQQAQQPQPQPQPQQQPQQQSQKSPLEQGNKIAKMLQQLAS